MSNTVDVREEPTELYKILKLANLVGSGGEAKFVIAEGLVQVNGEVETRKRRKTMAGDVVSFDGQSVTVRLRAEKD
ncbi:RNA-binding S4 domain-containing protein [Actomonas aquatica]|uniref:RNA-binding S4 domain-containing protein n=1 Tax=Actomonas aquatica TaxID=2866162 RepID=A0ABZ1C5K0_9BACT|nr:RNA-binding S4 domain-containing protein [Opitutus sp. WL0086]WRQ86628.1 RNA-binding S4 domain-containing protein [Opitutus sp. WL0086]